jgi:putative endonuclease
MKQFYVYILASKSRVIYTGVTSNLQRRVYEHKNKLFQGFTSKYNVNRLVYYEVMPVAETAIAREKQIKGWLREKKIALIESVNPTWQDLSKDWEDSDAGS